jgi:hypothetical protein
LQLYLYGTELPDNVQAPDGVGDTSEHHVYFYANGSLQDDSSAVRAQQEYDIALNYARVGEWTNASKTLGVMTHYISDVGVFGHVMGVRSDWGVEVHHSDYEDYVGGRTTNYTSEFNSYLVFDGGLESISAYDAALTLAFNTTFGDNSNYNCVWMDQNYNWNDPRFENRCGESLNLAVNLVSDVLHSFYQKSIIPEYRLNLLPALFVIVTLFTAIILRKKRPASTS